PFTENTVENRVVGVIARADDQSARLRPFGGEIHDLDLLFGKPRQVAPHVVEQDREVVDTDAIEFVEFPGERFARRAVEAEVKLIRAEADAEANAFRPAMICQIYEMLDLFLRVRLVPAPPQKGVGLRRVEIEAIAMRREGADMGRARLPAPGASVKTFNGAEFGRHTPERITTSSRRSLPSGNAPRRRRRADRSALSRCAAPRTRRARPKPGRVRNRRPSPSRYCPASIHSVRRDRLSSVPCSSRSSRCRGRPRGKSPACFHGR